VLKTLGIRRQQQISDTLIENDTSELGEDKKNPFHELKNKDEIRSKP
jgi:hypothetical protein